ncbi:MAG: YybH family protein [Geminicoccaceae bacterium]
MDASALRSQVEAAYRAWDTAFNRGDPKALAALYTQDATFLPATHAVIEGPAGIEDFFAGLFANGVTGHRLELITVHGDTNTVIGAANWSVSGKNADGSDATSSGVATHVFEKQPDGSLKLKLHTFN